MHCDCLIIGGGPAGTTLGALLKRYKPELDVVIVERKKFPRDHVGESQLPTLTGILEEMGVWEKVEAANFPIKIGSTYRWGANSDLWNLNFLSEPLRSDPRPAPLQGQRIQVAFQVDRSVYDKILLDHAASVGCQVFEETKLVRVGKTDGVIDYVDVAPTNAGETADETRITARYYIDASGMSGSLRRELDIPVEYPTPLKNLAFWDYYQNTEWRETVGSGGTRVLIMSVGWGWLWFIPITTTRTSIGLVTHGDYFKKSGKKPEEIYLEAIAQEPEISKLVASATREGKFEATKDWSYLAQTLAGENWFLVGDACGFADPILSAGLTLSQMSSRKVAYSILALEEDRFCPDWIRSEYTRSHRANITQHHKFAEYWYSANSCFTELKEYCQDLAREAGINLDGDAAFRWLAAGGFTAGNLPDVRGTGFGLTGNTGIAGKILGTPGEWTITKHNTFTLNLEGASKQKIAYYGQGQLDQIECYTRGDKILPIVNANELVLKALEHESDAICLSERFRVGLRMKGMPAPSAVFLALEALEGMVLDGWVTATTDPTRPPLPYHTPSLMG